MFANTGIITKEQSIAKYKAGGDKHLENWMIINCLKVLVCSFEALSD